MKNLIFAFLPLAIFAAVCTNDIPTRIQWNENSGYCGEVSFISAGLYYGQYLSQYDARATVGDQNKNPLLLGINDDLAVQKMHLNVDIWDFKDQQSTHDFLSWVKRNANAGYPVIIGVYVNQNQVYGNPNPDAGDDEYDHIVPVFSFSSNHSLDDPAYYGDDAIFCNDNGLWELFPDHRFNCTFDKFQANREQANQSTGNIYSLAICNPSKQLFNYGVAVKGIKDLKNETVPVRVDTSANYESPDIKDGSNDRPPSMPLTLTITVSKMEPNTSYNLYKYKQLNQVPESDFNAHASQASQQWTIQSQTSTYTMTDAIQSDEIAVYRCVKK